MTVDSDLREAVLIDGFAIDAETGEIFGDQIPDTDHLAMLLKDGQEQEKAWGAHNAMIKSALGRRLDEVGVRALETKFGVACWRVQNRRSAKAADLEALCDQVELTTVEEIQLWRCARDLDPKKLDELITSAWLSTSVASAVADLIEEKTVSYVLLQPLRKQAPKLERQTVDTGDY